MGNQSNGNLVLRYVGVDHLEDSDAESAARNLSKVSQIDVLKSISAGESGSHVLLVDVEVQSDAEEEPLRVRLLKAMEESLDQSGLKKLLFLLDIKEGNIAGDTLSDRFINLIRHREQDHHDAVPELVDRFLELKPDFHDMLRDAVLPGHHYLKLFKISNRRDAEDRLRRIRSLYDTAIGRAVPRIVDYASSQNYMAALHNPAKGKISSENVVGLSRLLNDDSTLAGDNLSNLAALLVEWNRGMPRKSCEPYELLIHQLGPRRTSGPESVQARARRLLGVSDQGPRLTVRGTTLPNPVAFVAHSDWWQSDESRPLKVPLGHVHGDLHAGNLICLRQRRREEPLPDILDFDDYQDDGLTFFDLAYFEFDILKRVFPPNELENRTGLLELVLTLTQNVTLPRGSSGGSLAYTALSRIRPLREAVQRMVSSDREEDDECAFWLAAVAAGLNFSRKLPITDHERMLALIYAAAALKKVCKNQGIAYLDIQGEKDPLHIPWPDWSPPTEEEGITSDPSDPEEVAVLIADLLRENQEPVLFVCGPEFHAWNTSALVEDLKRRLRWTNYGVRINVIEETDLGTAIAAYREEMTDLNVRSALRRHVAQNDPSSWLPLLAALGIHEQATVATFDWDERLDEMVGLWTEPYHVERHILRLCGDLKRPNSVCSLDDFPLEKDHLVFDGVSEAQDTLRAQLRRARVVFLGNQPVNNQGWHSLVGDNLVKPRRDLPWGVWLVTDDRRVQQDDLPDPTTLVQCAPEGFLRLVLDHLGIDPEPPSESDGRVSLEGYEPRPVDQQVTIQHLLDDREPKRWVLYSEPGEGKSYTLGKASKEHTEREQKEVREAGNEPAPTYHVIVDFAADERLAHNRRGVIHLLFDHFDCEIPEMRLSRKTASGQGKTNQLLKEFMIAAPFTNGHYIKRQILFGFDNLHLADDEHMVRWLREDVAHTLVGDPPRFGEQPWTLDAGTSIAKVVMTMRFSGGEFPKHRWSGFSIRSLDSYQEEDALEMLNDYLKHVKGLQRLVKTEEVWKEKLSRRYFEVSGGHIGAMSALIRHHASLEFAPRPNWPSKDELPQMQTDVMFPAAWEAVEQSLEYDKYREFLDDLYRSVFMCRRLKKALLERILQQTCRDLPDIPQPQMMKIENHLRSAGFIYTDDPPDWFFVSPGLHRIVRDTHRDADIWDERFKRFWAINKMACQFYHRLAEYEKDRLEEFWKRAVVDALYHYHFLYVKGRGILPTPLARLKDYLDQFLEVRGLDKSDPEVVDTIKAGLRVQAQEVPLHPDLLNFLKTDNTGD